MKFNSYYSREVSPGEKNTKPSKTVPDQAMTIAEIIQRTQKGLPITGVRVPMYNETEDGIMPDVSRMDISEVYALKRAIAAKEKEIRQRLQEEEQKRQQEETEAYYKKKFGTPPPKPTEITPTEVID